MDAIREYLEKIREIFDGLGRNQKIGGGAGIGVLLLLIIFMSSGGGDDVVYRPLYTDMDIKEAGEIAGRLREMNQNFKLGGDGALVLVPEEDRASYNRLWRANQKRRFRNLRMCGCMWSYPKRVCLPISKNRQKRRFCSICARV